MAWTSSDLAALEVAIKNGHRRVRYRDREVEYQSLQDMRDLRQEMKQEIAGAGFKKTSVATTRRGY